MNYPYTTTEGANFQIHASEIKFHFTGNHAVLIERTFDFGRQEQCIITRGDVALYLNEEIGFDEVESDKLSYDVFDMLAYSYEYCIMIVNYINAWEPINLTTIYRKR